jgi:hypothetical protein
MKGAPLVFQTFLPYIYPEKMARPRNLHKPVQVTITGTPKLASYLDALVKEEGYGNSRAEVAKTLIWRGIEELLSKGILDQIRGPRTEE